MTRILMLWLAGLLLGAIGSGAAAAGEVTIGTYVNNIEDVNFRENKYTLDFFVWFRWKAEGELVNYKPLESLEVLNGRVEDRSSIVEKKIGGLQYASARIRATMADTWDLAAFPFDWHRSEVRIEDSVYTAEQLQFVPDRINSRLGDEIDIAGWQAVQLDVRVIDHVYRTNFGDVSLPTAAQSRYSRFVASWDIHRTGWGGAVKLLMTAFLSVAVGFASLLVRATDLDARFGMGVGALFAVVASAFVVSSAVPDSGTMTLADLTHIVALGFIFTILLISAYCLRLETRRHQHRAAFIDHLSLVILPPLFYGWAAWAIFGALRR
jgi:hypothetical protein